MTRNFNSFVRTAAVAAFLSFASAAFALPSNRTITYSIREAPTNEESDVLWTITLHLHAYSQMGSAVGWQVTQIDFRRTNGEDPDSVWTDSNPEFNDIENLWWVTHANTNAPTPREFDNFPFTTKTAAAVSNAENDLDYELETTTSSSGMFSGNVVASSYVLTETGDAEPDHEGSGEPIETNS